jgi:hypothetical protein
MRNNGTSKPLKHRSFISAAVAALMLGMGMLASPPAAHGGGLDGIEICHGFNCRIKESVSISENEWNQIKAFFRRPAENAEMERDQIRRAAGWFEVIIGRYTPIHLNKGGNNFPGRFDTVRLEKDRVEYLGSAEGQMDCIDESLNMTTYLTLMEEAGLFKYHRVVERAHRRSAVDQHYAGQIEEIDSGARWVLDSWFYDHGRLPYLEEAEEWHDIPFLFSTSFPRAADG